MSTAVCSNLLTNLGDVIVFVTAPFITSLRAIYFILCVSGFVPHDDAGDVNNQATHSFNSFALSKYRIFWTSRTFFCNFWLVLRLTLNSNLCN